MSIITRMRKQTLVYWGSPVPDGYGGATFAAAVELSCRWEDKQELFVAPNGKEVLSQSVVYVGVDVDIGGYLYLGLESDLDSNHTNPEIISGAREIRQFSKLPTLRATEYLRTAWL